MIDKDYFDKLVETYETSDFIKDDPIQFAHRFKKEEDIELAGFIASCFAYGNRKVFIKKLNTLFSIMENKPVDFLKDFDKSTLKGFEYRFYKDKDVITFFEKLNNLYKNEKSLKTLFKSNFNDDIIDMLQKVCDYFYEDIELTQGYCHFIPCPSKKGAMKRMNMFLRWLVRKNSKVDLGIWSFIPTSKLLIPLDTHVARISRETGLLTRNSNDIKSVIEITENLKKFDKNDPVKYDFALFGYGVNHPIK